MAKVNAVWRVVVWEYERGWSAKPIYHEIHTQYLLPHNIHLQNNLCPVF